MRMAAPLLSVALLVGCASANRSTTLVAPDPQTLVGTWTVDLRPKPGDPDYFQAFTVSAVNGKSFAGTFYGSTIEQGRINTDWGAVRIAFVTSDQSGPYHHSAVLLDGRLTGLSNSTGRDFLSYWSAVKRR